MIQTVKYPYEPSPDDLANFEAIWLVGFHPRLSNIPTNEYMILKNLIFEGFLIGINQQKYNVIIDLERSLDQ